MASIAYFNLGLGKEIANNIIKSGGNKLEYLSLPWERYHDIA